MRNALTVSRVRAKDYGAFRAFKSGAPPTPDMAIEEAKRIRETVSS